MSQQHPVSRHALKPAAMLMVGAQLAGCGEQYIRLLDGALIACQVAAGAIQTCRKLDRYDPPAVRDPRAVIEPRVIECQPE